jgi:hypothetical protein
MIGWIWRRGNGPSPWKAMSPHKFLLEAFSCLIISTTNPGFYQTDESRYQYNHSNEISLIRIVITVILLSRG